MKDVRISAEGLERIAFATSYSNTGAVETLRWTELAIYFRPDERRPFFATAIGKTKMPGEKEFYRQRHGKTIEDVCAIFDNSRLADQIIEQAQAWTDRQERALKAAQPLTVVQPAIRFDGAGGLRGALLWLYPAAPGDSSDSALASGFAQDFGVPDRTVRHALKQERDGADLTPWVKAFIGALMHFDRDAFHAMRRA